MKISHISLLLLLALLCGCSNGVPTNRESDVELEESSTFSLSEDEELIESKVETIKDTSENIIETTDEVDEYSKENAAISGTMESLELMGENSYKDTRLIILSYVDNPDGIFTKFRALAINESAVDDAWIGPGMLLVDNDELDNYHKQCFYVDKDVLYHTNNKAIFNAIGYGSGVLEETNFVWADGTKVQVEYATEKERKDLRDEAGILSLRVGALGLAPIVKMFVYDEAVWEEQKDLGYIDIYLNMRRLGMDEYFIYGEPVRVYDKSGNDMLENGTLKYMGELTFRIEKYLTFEDASSILEQIDKIEWETEDGTKFSESVLSMEQYQKGESK